jgi:hypothetical protein
MSLCNNDNTKNLWYVILVLIYIVIGYYD